MFGKLFMPKVNDVQQAKKAYKKYEHERSSYSKKQFVIQKWEELILPRLNKIIDEKNIDNLLTIMFDLPPCGETRKMANAAFKDFGLFLISTPQQAKTLYNRFSKEGDEFCLLTIREKWDQLSLAELEKANSIPTIKIVADGAFFNQKAFVKAIEKWATACQTFDQIKELSDYASAREYNINYCLNVRIRENITRRTNEILLDEIPKTNDMTKLKYYYNYASNNSSAKLLAFEKWLECCTTPQEADEAFKVAHGNKATACQTKAYERVKELDLKYN